MLFRDVTGAGGRGSINCAHLSGGSSPRTDYAGPSWAPGALLSSPPLPGPEWGSEGAGPHGSAPDSATPPDHADDLAADSPAGFAAGNVGGLPGDAGVGGRDSAFSVSSARERSLYPPPPLSMPLRTSRGET